VSKYVTAKVCSGRGWEAPQSTGKQLRRCVSEQLRNCARGKPRTCASG